MIECNIFIWSHHFDSICVYVFYCSFGISTTLLLSLIYYALYYNNSITKSCLLRFEENNESICPVPNPNWIFKKAFRAKNYSSFIFNKNAVMILAIRSGVWMCMWCKPGTSWYSRFAFFLSTFMTFGYASAISNVIPGTWNIKILLKNY